MTIGSLLTDHIYHWVAFDMSDKLSISISEGQSILPDQDEKEGHL